jgi:arylsulfatase A-like enzyme
MRTPRTLALLSSSLVLSALAGACGGGAGEPSPAASAGGLVFHPVLRASGESPAREPELEAHLAPPAEVAPWSVLGAQSVGVGPLIGENGAAGASVLTAERVDELLRIVVPGSFDPTRFNRVRLTLSVRGRSSPVTVLFRRGGKVVARSRTASLHGTSSPLPVLFDFPRNAFEESPFDEVEVQVGPCYAARIGSIELLRQDPRAWFPHPGEEPELVFLGGDGRRAVGIASGEPATARLETTRPGDRVTLSYALPETLRFKAQRPTLTVALTGSSGISSRSVVLDADAEGWRRLEVPLNGLAGAPVALALSLDSAQGGPTAIALVAELALVGADEPPPSVLLVTSDTHRADHVGSASDAVLVRTPALDALAARGVLFESGWSTTNITVPSHVALLTGVHPRDARIVNNVTSLASAAPTLAERFREAGYTTLALVSANHLAHRVSGLGQGFDRQSVPDGATRSGGDTVAVLERWLPELDGQPLFVWVHVYDAHAPYDPPGEFAAPYEGQIAGDGGNEDLQRARYRGEVSYVDAELGKLFEREPFRSGIVGVTADHGEILVAHGMSFNHHELYSDTMHVPLILAWPGAPAGARVPRPVAQSDLGRTLLDLAAHADVEFPGTSLLRAIEAPERDTDPLFGLAENGFSASVRFQGWYLILHLLEHRKGDTDGMFALHELELFHLAVDPGCANELSAAEPQQVRKLRELLVRWLASARDTGWATVANLDAEDLADLVALGYMGQTSATSGSWIDPDCNCERCAAFR